MKALLIVDVQNDFSPTGALPVQGGDEIVPFVNQKQDEFDLVVATQDWHPQTHRSFAIHHPGKKPGDMIDLNGVEQILWPVHCVQDSFGADFIPWLNVGKFNHIVQKGVGRDIDSYSGFFDNDRQNATGLHQYLQDHKVDTLYIVGLATDYCVKYTALDAANLGYNTSVYKEGVRGVELNPGDIEKAFIEMKDAGINIIE